jgi:hypothetical protein
MKKVKKEGFIIFHNQKLIPQNRATTGQFVNTDNNSGISNSNFPVN